MCAINGITKNDAPLVVRMNEATRHRGPDGSEVWEGNGITLGHNRLAIIDLSESALQPMHSSCGRYSIVFNGEIYNYRELRSELEHEYTFKTKSDTEVLLYAYIKWGDMLFSRLRGMFAFGVWDAQKSSLILARDHLGIKPLYYNVKNNVLSFSSEIPALLSGIATRNINEESLAYYLSMEYVPSPQTLVADIQKLRPGHTLHFKEGVMTIRSYLEPAPQKTHVTTKTIYDTIGHAVHRQLVSDRPVGAYLSGGFDSSIVVHHISLHHEKVRTYSVDFESVLGNENEAEKFNADARLAEKTAQFYGTQHKTFTITLADIRNTIEIAVQSANEPIANSTAITQYLLSDFVRKDGTVVVLGGDGGDELFGGYTRHRIAMGAYLYQQLPRFVQSFGGTLSTRVQKLSTPFGTALHRALMVKDEKKIQPFLSCNLNVNAITTAFFDAEYQREVAGSLHPVDIFMRVDRRTWLPDECFIRSDYASMAHGVELRVPLVDIDVVRMSDQISIWRKTLPHEGKRIIRSAYRSHLPRHLYGQPKRGWLSPAAKWFRDPVVNEFSKQVFSSAYYDGLSGLFDWGRVHALLDDHVEKRAYYLYPLWNILVLQIWAQKNRIVYRR